MRDPHLVLVKPMVSEKSIILMEDNKYSFLVAKDANKIEIKHAVETLFNFDFIGIFCHEEGVFVILHKNDGFLRNHRLN